MIKIILSLLLSFILGSILSYFITVTILCTDPNDTACGLVLYVLTPFLIVVSFLVFWLLLKLFKFNLFQNRNQMFITFFALVILVAIYTLYENASPNLYSALYNKVGLFKSVNTQQISNEISKELGIREKALEYLRTKPDVNDQDWESFFKNSHLAQITRRGVALDYAWFNSHESTVITKGEYYIVSWKGLPGCEEDKSKPGGPEYGPNYFDKNGRRCGQLWLTEVYFDDNLKPIKVEIHEVGGVV
mgnify:CR=1 FL=1